jgi:hypothetical protein
MLFDLQGKRRRVVQGVYLMLAILMGGGLVLFGIGSDVSGGLADIFGSGSGGGSDNSAIEKRIDRNEERIQQGTKEEAARKALARDYYQLATSKATAEGTFDADAKADLSKAAANWEAYLALEPKKVDASLATLALQVYDPLALNKPKQAQEAARVIAEARNNSNSYIALVQYATLAGDKRVADLAAEKAIDLAPKGQEKIAAAQVKEAKKAAAQQQGAAAQPSGG